jgi:hypothetical protein
MIFRSKKEPLFLIEKLLLLKRKYRKIPWNKWIFIETKEFLKLEILNEMK